MQPLRRFLRGGTTRPNAARALRITLARRLVETQGAPFVPAGEGFTDVALVRDELGLLPASQGPTIVRVDVEGGTDEDRKGLAGDWLVDPDAKDRVARLPVPRWSYSDKVTEWACVRPWLEAWETCEDARWMLHAAREAEVDRRLLVLAACACARMALPFVPTGEARPLQAIEAAEGWTRGEATDEEVRTAIEAAWYAASAASAVRSVRAAAWASAYAAASASTSAFGYSSDALRDAVWASASAFGYSSDAVRVARADDRVSVDLAALAAGWTDADARTMSLARSADLVRGVIPTLVVLRAVATRA